MEILRVSDHSAEIVFNAKKIDHCNQFVVTMFAKIIAAFDRFSEVSNRYRAALDNCFMHSPVPPRNEFAPRFIDGEQ